MAGGTVLVGVAGRALVAQGAGREEGIVGLPVHHIAAGDQAGGTVDGDAELAVGFARRMTTLPLSIMS